MFAGLPFERLSSITAIAIPADMTTAIDISEYLKYDFLKRSIPKDDSITKIIEPIVGLIPIRKPAATPASATWDNVSPICESLLNTKKLPTNGAIIDINPPARNALIIKSYVKILSIITPQSKVDY